MERGGEHVEPVEVGEESVVVGDCAFAVNCSLFRNVKDVIDDLRRRAAFHFFDLVAVDSDRRDIGDPAAAPVERIAGVRLLRRRSAPGVDSGALVLSLSSQATVQSAYDPPGPIYLRLAPGDTVKNVKPIDDKRVMCDLNGLTGLIPRWKIASLDDVLYAAQVLRHSGAQLELGERYADGTGGVKLNAAKGAAWLSEAARLRNADAMAALAANFADGHGVAESPARALELYREAAELGQPVAQFQLGRHYQQGRGVPSDVTKAIACYQRAAKQGYHEAQLHLGLFYFRQREHALAYGEFALAAEQENWLAIAYVGLCLERGAGVPADAAKAVALYTRAADRGCVFAYYRLGKCYIRGRGVEKRNEAHGLSLVKFAASSAYTPCPAAQCFLGRLYRDGAAVAKDLNVSFAWFKRAADAGKRAALFELAECYARGRGTLPDGERAFALYMQAAEQEKAAAQCEVGLQQAARGDLEQAVGWLRRAGQQGNLVALYENAKIHMGVLRNAPQGLIYLRKAAEGGLVDALLTLGRLHRGGSAHVAHNVAKAVPLFERAAAQGSTEAMRELGAVYFAGEPGLAVDAAKGEMWLRRAASLGDPAAQAQLVAYQRRKDREARLREKGAAKRGHEAEAVKAPKAAAGARAVGAGAAGGVRGAKRGRSVRIGK